MESGKQQIIGYFIEEAKEHLGTIERGLLNLQSTIEDPEQVNELFRAAHSIKGGAAMLGFGGIQKLSHRMEDCFKILKDQPLEVNQTIESQFLQGFDSLQDLVERLQDPFGLSEDAAEQSVRSAEPVFQELLNALKTLSDKQLTPGGAPSMAAPAIAPMSRAPMPSPVARPSANFLPEVMTTLKQMLTLFKQTETPNNRQQLSMLCDRLGQVGQGIEPWTALLGETRRAIGNTRNPYRILAPVVIKELKQASDLVAGGRSAQIRPSADLQRLAQFQPVSSSPVAPTPSPRQVAVTLEPKAAAQTLVNAFSRDQLVEFIRYLQASLSRVS